MMVTQFDIDRFIFIGKAGINDPSTDRWREDCRGCTKVSGVTVRQWQMVYRAHGSGREGPNSQDLLCAA